MPRIAKNQLTIQPVLDNKNQPAGFRLFGYFNGKKIRRWSKDPAELETLKASLEGAQEAVVQAEVARSTSRMTYLSADRIRDAEAAVRALEGKPFSLLACVNAALPILNGPAPMLATEAEEKFLDNRRLGKKSLRTIRNYQYRLKAFREETKIKYLHEITTEMIEDYALKPNLTVVSQLTRGVLVSTWLNFCADKGFIKANPCKLDFRAMSELADRTKGKDHILTPAQAEALLRAAIAFKGGVLVPYVILCTWCFIRATEVRHITLGDLRLAKGEVYVWGRKRGGKFRPVTIPPNVLPLLKECVERKLVRDGANNRHGKITPGCIPFSLGQWRSVRDAAGLITLTAGGQRGQRVLSSDWKQNVLRHTGESYLYQKTGDLALCTNQAGHSKGTAARHYLYLPEDGGCDKFYAITGKLVPAALELTA